MAIDIHCHILPEVDDGADSIEESVQMCINAANSGVTEIICTPHFVLQQYENADIISPYEKLKRELAERDIAVNLQIGNEIYLEENTLPLIKSSKVFTLAGSNYVLVEFPMSYMPFDAGDLILTLKKEGYLPIIAHPERYEAVIEDVNVLYELLELGALAQVNIYSIIGRNGKDIKKAVQAMLNCGMVSFIASDAHKASHLARWKEAAHELERCAPLSANSIIENASFILRNERISASPISSYKKRRFSSMFDIFARR